MKIQTKFIQAKREKKELTASGIWSDLKPKEEKRQALQWGLSSRWKLAFRQIVAYTDTLNTSMRAPQRHSQLVQLFCN